MPYSVICMGFVLLTVITANFECTEHGQSFRLTFNIGSLTTSAFGRVDSTISVPLNELTLCYWARVHNVTSRTVFSYAVPKRFDEIWTGIDVKRSGKSSVFFHRQYKENQTLDETGVSAEADVSKGEWVDICIVWSRMNGLWRIYVKGKPVGQGLGLAEDYRIVAGGIAIFGQDQDEYGGVFQAEDAFHGDLSEFHLWDYILLSSEISQFHTCSLNNEGNVLAWSKTTFKLEKGVELAPVRLPCGSITA